VVLGFLGSLVEHVHAAASEDLIKTIPYLDPPAVSFKQYGGYLDTRSPRQLFYWFMESQGNPATDTILIWINGGPGCSGLGYLFNVQGPWEMYQSRDYHKGVRLRWKDVKAAWNKESNLLLIDQPAGAGFSHSLDGNITTDDTQTARDNNIAITDFFLRKFPEYLSNDIYIFGESYASKIAMATVLDIIDSGIIQLTGVGLSSGMYVDQDTLYKFILMYQRYHGILSKQQWDTFVRTCCKEQSNIEDCF
jgi:cathepsin A (carboxypeptidase C)